MRATSLLFAILFGTVINAQDTAVPEWMASYFGPTTPVLETTDDVATTRNSFIGTYMVRITIRHDGITQQLYVSQWSDPTRGIVQVQMIPGFPHTTYFADLASNTAVIANIIDRKARAGELSAVLLTDRMGSPGEGAEFAPFSTTDTERRDTIAGIDCAEHYLVEGRDTMHLWLADITPSPFAEAPAWIPLNEGPLKVFRLLYKLGDRVAFRFALQPMLELEVLEYTAGEVPPPRIDLSSYAVERMTMPEKRP
jgi:hypothetical protein